MVINCCSGDIMRPAEFPALLPTELAVVPFYSFITQNCHQCCKISLLDCHICDAGQAEALQVSIPIIGSLCWSWQNFLFVAFYLKWKMQGGKCPGCCRSKGSFLWIKSFFFLIFLGWSQQSLMSVKTNWKRSNMKMELLSPGKCWNDISYFWAITANILLF